MSREKKGYLSHFGGLISTAISPPDVCDSLYSALCLALRFASTIFFR